MAQMAGLVTKK